MEAVIFSGVQASGKSMLFKMHFADTHVRVNLDMLRTRHRQRLLITACLDAKQQFVIDNTNLTIAERAPHIAAASRRAFAWWATACTCR